LVAQKKFTKFYVCCINVTPKEVPQGGVLFVVFSVFYSDYSPCGDPAELKPRAGQTQPTASFVISGSTALQFTDIPVVPTGTPGEYRAEISWPASAPIGKEVVFITTGSLYDGKTTGPGQETSYVETPDPTDDSTFVSRSASPIVAIFDFIPGGVATIMALLALLILLAVLLLLMMRRRRKV
jgi:hypothetical protein